MKSLLNIITTALMAWPVMTVIGMFLPDGLTWWQAISLGIVSVMIADYWLRGQQGGGNG